MKATELNTIELIRQWSMRGAGGDVSERFPSPVDIRAALGARVDRPKGVRVVARPRVGSLGPLLVKQPDEEEWRSLVAGATNGRGRL